MKIQELPRPPTQEKLLRNAAMQIGAVRCDELIGETSGGHPKAMLYLIYSI
jgi:hypothetical protein